MENTLRQTFTVADEEEFRSTTIPSVKKENNFFEIHKPKNSLLIK
jgi:hypothetical protein